jgi:hypothetical protein
MLGGFMKDFLHNYSYSAVKMFVNQFVISLFGAMLSMASTATESDSFAIVLSVIAVLFYLFLLYTLSWEIGAKDRISVDIGKKKYRPYTGLVVSFVANIPNFIIAIAYCIGSPFMTTQKWAGNLCAISRFFTMLFEGMYLGLITSIKISGEMLNAFWWTYFLMTIPAMLTSFIAYYLGFKNKKFTTLFDYRSPDKAKRK